MPVQAPPADDVHYVERILRLPHVYVPYAPVTGAPPVAPPPHLANGVVTLGGFHNPAKLNDRVLALWSEVLIAVPHSRLLLIYRGLDTSELGARIRGVFAAAGVDPGRIVLEGTLPHAELLAAYGRLDIALDPFPYSGGVTTCEALWMGVPVVTMTGRTFAGRHATAYLRAVGLDELVAGDERSYLEIVTRIATDSARLTVLRATLRARMAASPLGDHPGYAAAFGAAVRGVWLQWCRASRERD